MRHALINNILAFSFKGMVTRPVSYCVENLHALCIVSGDIVSRAFPSEKKIPQTEQLIQTVVHFACLHIS